MITRDSDISKVKGVGKKTQGLLNRLGVFSVNDMLNYYPKAYIRYEKPVKAEDISKYINKEVAVYGEIISPLKIEKSFRGNKTIITCQIKDETKVLSLIWFNAPFLRNVLRMGQKYIFYGYIKQDKFGKFKMEQPRYYSVTEYNSLMANLMPVYGKTAGLTNNMIIKIMKEIINSIPDKKDYLYENLRKKYEMAGYNYSIKNIHFPKTENDLKFARDRLIFDEFFMFLYHVKKIKSLTEHQKSKYIINSFRDAERLITKLPFKLSNAQFKVWEELQNDFISGKVMRRILQGDVGAGKTIIAVLSLLAVCENNYQGALMAPTEVLAKQHYESIQDMFKEYDIPYKIGLLTGATKTSERKQIYQELESGEIDILIGTHALISEKVQYKNLGLVITDEQHRFGVNQREQLSEKGDNPHVIVMSATPIPRTLALILYGDMDISVIDELPAHRLPIKNCVVNDSYRNKAYDFIVKEVQMGRQAYVICPLIEENEDLPVADVITYCKNLNEILPKDIKCEYLHGRMTNEEKNNIMNRFRDNEIQVLVSTVVIEVGINVPNATVILIENAERFGLATLHQLRGRVGRGAHQSYCIMIQGIDNEKTKERLDILNKSNDGFYIASMDLKQRGSGDIFGYRQSGIMNFSLGDIYEDADILVKAKEAVEFVQRESKPEIERFIMDEMKNYNIINAL